VLLLLFCFRFFGSEFGNVRNRNHVEVHDVDLDETIALDADTTVNQRHCFLCRGILDKAVIVNLLLRLVRVHLDTNNRVSILHKHHETDIEKLPCYHSESVQTLD
jgi:hypothetical protein